ncbi:hypothetical protein Tsubulata_036520 [Turnera subulata]|uniref:Piwi domain-containing protein n=1 Tax=Turnera subulata TaxID=218843 RepID=A0A9Q0FT92_9ROSI|nr:hypothetical protein Tsubulata_036520 [Turnera subulata]
MIDVLFKPVFDTEDQGMIREALLDLYSSSGNPKSEQIFIFRDGVSESQFNQALNIELDQITEGSTQPSDCYFLYDQLGFSADDIQQLVHSLSLCVPKEHHGDIHSGSNMPMQQLMKLDDLSESSSSHNGVTSAPCCSCARITSHA